MLERELASIAAQKEAAALAEDYERAAKLRQSEMQVHGAARGGAAQGGRDPTMIVTPADIAQVVEGLDRRASDPDAGGGAGRTCATWRAI